MFALRVTTPTSRGPRYPARVIIPGVTGNHNTKWVRELRFEPASEELRCLAISGAAMAPARCTWQVICRIRGRRIRHRADRQRGAGLAKVIAPVLGFVIAHDLIFVPAYSGTDRVVRATLGRLPAGRSARVPAMNHIRAPMLISGLLLIMYFPLISQKATRIISGERPPHQGLPPQLATDLGRAVLRLGSHLRAAIEPWCGQAKAFTSSVRTSPNCPATSSALTIEPSSMTRCPDHAGPVRSVATSAPMSSDATIVDFRFVGL